LDLGILYSVKGDLKAGANSLALAAAQQLIGTDTSVVAAAASAQLTVDNRGNFGNKYYFQGLPIGQTTGTAISTVSDPAFYGTAADAIASGSTGGAQVGGTQARHVRVTVTGQTQLLFWSFLPLASDRNITVLASSVAGISPPLCTACGIEPFAVAAPNQADSIDLGFTPGVTYVLTYLCTGLIPTPPGGLPQILYVMLNRLDPNATVFADEDSQAFRAGAGGLPGNTNSAQACFRVNNTETIWASAVVNQCALNRVAPVVNNALCGLDTRFETAPAACAGITNVETLAQAYLPDTDIDPHDSYADYTGNGRRIITIPIVDAVSAGTMTVLGFRQFLVMQGNPSDSLGRFQAMYIGSVAPVKQGRFDGCQLASGPGKVVLHQ
jgi:hypothetical protein